MGCTDDYNSKSHDNIFTTTMNFPTHNLFHYPHNHTTLFTNLSTFNNHQMDVNNGGNDHQLQIHHHHRNQKKQDEKEEMMNNEQVPSSNSSARWNPTPEQLLALEEFYRRGTRTPTADQIQQIATRLSKFGKIEGKNVFYWFQNHKARERQKRRRQVDETKKLQEQETGLKRTGYEVENIKNLAPSSHRSKITEELYLMHGAESYGTQYEERELEERKRSTNSKPFTFSYDNTSPPLFTPIPLNTTNLLINNIITKQNDTVSPLKKPNKEENFFLSGKHEVRETETLQLFPVNNNGIHEPGMRKDKKLPIKTINTTNFTASNQYFEFLPMKNC